MPGASRECRKRAAHCLELAADAANDGIKQMFLNLARHWEALALELERAKSILDDEKGGLKVGENKRRRTRSAAGKSKRKRKQSAAVPRNKQHIGHGRRMNDDAGWSLW